MPSDVRPLKIREIPALHRQFVDAINGSFSYIEEPYSQKIRQENTPARLLLAWAHPRRVVLVGSNKGELTGYAIGAVNKGRATLYWLYVSPQHRGQQLGLALMQAFEDTSRSLGGTSVGLSTYDHQSYYSDLGYKKVKEERLHGQPMKIMVKDIS